MDYKNNSRLAAFKCAFAGLRRLGKEPHFRLHLAIAASTTAAGILCRLSLVEWCMIIICFGSVLAAEGLNTAVEILADRVCERKDNSIKLAKDVAAAAVLLASFAAAVVGGVIFVGKLILPQY